MSLKHVTSGNNIPHDIYVIIEISLYSHPIKYEINKQSEMLYVDRFIPTAMVYPCNYGYINHTLSKDGDPLDVLIPITYSLQPNCVIKCRPIGMLKMIDESGEDSKIIAVPHQDICKDYNHITNINDLSSITKKKIIHFFEHYKDLEDEKWIKIIGWKDVEHAKKEIISSIQNALNNKT